MYIVADGNALAHRCWHTPPISGRLDSDDWRDISTLFLTSFVSQLTAVVERIDRFRPKFTKLIICWDGSESTKLRKKLYPLYKENRKAEREKTDPKTQLPYALIEWTRLELEKVAQRYSVYHNEAEGDDLLALLCEVFGDEEVCLVTRDKDMYQLVKMHTRILDPSTHKLVGPEQVLEQFGVTPNLIPELKSYMGDDSDGYPGIKGVGPVGALKLIGTNMEHSHPDTKIFRELATIPFPRLDTTAILEHLATTDLDSIPRWEQFIEEHGIGERLAARLLFVV